MLDLLFGNKSVERVLYFLLVNEKCYATEIHKRLNCSLTAVQNALEKLAKGNILESHLEGKTKIYAFNPQYPLLTSLENLLKEGYNLLTLSEKKHYYITENNDRGVLLASLWEKLQEIKHISFTARSLTSKTVMGMGKGNVQVEYDQKATIIFHESGEVIGQDGKTYQFKNVFRWTYHRIENMLALEHLRLGMNHPVFLFHLIPKGPKLLESFQPHLCGKDTYLGSLKPKNDNLILFWRIMGPKKNEEIEYTYL